MSYTGGDITEITYSHPTVGNGTIYAKSAEDSTIDRGGYIKNDDQNSVSGDGQNIDVMNRKRWRVELGPIAWDITDRDELDKLQQIQNSPLPADWTIAHITGTIWGGKGSPVGDLNATTNNPQIAVILAGGGTLDKIN